MSGRGGADRLFGGGADDMLFGGGGADRLRGGGGDDFLQGGSGRDVLRGDRGRDTFAFSEGDGRDTVLDFRPGADEVLIVAKGPTLTFEDLAIRDVRGGAAVRFDGAEVIFRGLKAEDLDASDFSFF